MPLDDPRNTLWELDTDQVKPDVAKELLRQAELRQEAIFRAALGMDQRAAVLAAGFTAAAGAVAAAALTVRQAMPGLFAGALAGAAVLAIAAALCAYACRPQKFRFPGIEPKSWGVDPAFLSHSITELRLSRVAQLQDHMTANEQRQQKNGRALQGGLYLAVAAPVVAILISVGS